MSGPVRLQRSHVPPAVFGKPSLHPRPFSLPPSQTDRRTVPAWPSVFPGATGQPEPLDWQAQIDRAALFGHNVEHLTAGRVQPAQTQAPIQRALNEELLGQARQQNGSTLSQELHGQLSQRIQQFNTSEPDLANVEDAQQRKQLLDAQYQRLHEIEQLAHGWMRDNHQNANQSDRNAVFGLLNEVESHHAQLVQKTLQGGHELWLPDSVNDNEKNRARGIWSSIREGQGNVRVEGNDEFRTRTLASTAKLLEGQHGRDMLEELNADQGDNADRQIRIGGNWQQEFLQIPGSEWKAGSWASSIHSIRDRNDLRHRSPDPGLRGEGSGSYVQIDDDSPPVSGTHDEPLHMPSYITLGHELGHAVRNLRGESRGPGYDRPGDLSHDNEFEQRLQRTLWTSPEEHQNITQHENALRAEHGLPDRSFHKPPQTVALERSKDGLYRRLRAANDRIPLEHNETVSHHLPALNQAIALFHPGPSDEIPDWTDQATHQQAGHLVGQVEAGLDDAIHGAQQGLLQPPQVDQDDPVEPAQQEQGMPLWQKIALGGLVLGGGVLGALMLRNRLKGSK